MNNFSCILHVRRKITSWCFLEFFFPMEVFFRNFCFFRQIFVLHRSLDDRPLEIVRFIFCLFWILFSNTIVLRSYHAIFRLNLGGKPSSWRVRFFNVNLPIARSLAKMTNDEIQRNYKKFAVECEWNNSIPSIRAIIGFHLLFSWVFVRSFFLFLIFSMTRRLMGAHIAE